MDQVRSLKLLAVGYYGAGNVGDELLLRQLVLQARSLNGSVTAVSFDPAHTRSQHGIEAIWKADTPGVVQAVQSHDAVVLGGGGLFQDHYAFPIADLFRYPAESISYYAQIPLLASSFGRPCLLWAMGVGPLRFDEGRQIVREVVRRAHTVTVRDQGSVELLGQLETGRSVPCAPDPIWAAEPAPPLAWELRERFPALKGRKVLALVVREWGGDEGWQARLQEALRSSLDEGWGCLWIPFQPSTDKATIQTLIGGVGGEAHAVWDDPALLEIESVLGKVDAAFAMRLHGLVLAARCGVPLVSFEYDPKVALAAEALGLEQRFRVNPGDSAERIREAFSALLQGTRGYSAERSRELGAQSAFHNEVLSKFVADVASSAPQATWKADVDWASMWQVASVDELVALRTESMRLQRRVSELEVSLATVTKERDALGEAMTELQSRWSWTVYNKLRRAQQSVLPPGSRRRVPYEQVLAWLRRRNA